MRLVEEERHRVRARGARRARRGPPAVLDRALERLAARRGTRAGAVGGARGRRRARRSYAPSGAGPQEAVQDWSVAPTAHHAPDAAAAHSSTPFTYAPRRRPGDAHAHATAADALGSPVQLHMPYNLPTQQQTVAVAAQVRGWRAL